MANIYDKVPVKVQKKSGFDKSFQNLFTGKVGTIIPILTDELIPNSTVRLRMAITTQLPPLASDTFMRVKQKYAAFFVPTRILVPRYEEWLTGKNAGNSTVTKVVLPTLSFSPETDKAAYGNGSLLDYLGYKCSETKFTELRNVQLSALPLLAYHKIYNDWFRNSLVQKDIFNNALAASVVYNPATSSVIAPCSIASNRSQFTYKADSDETTAGGSKFADGVDITSLRQANFGSDLFTSCTPKPQNGEAQAVSFQTVNSNGKFTISALRAANSMQQFLERNNLAGNRLVDYVKAQYGANLNDAIAQRPVLLGSGSFDVYSKGVYQTQSQVENESVTSTNPFGSVGTKYGSAYVDGNDLVIEGFTAAEPGYLMVVTWLSPKVTYSTGVDPVLTRYTSVDSQSDMANPILQNVGNEPIYAKQLSMDQAITNSNDVFGYNERYANWKDKMDEVHGLLRDNASLSSFALQRTFGSFGITPNASPRITSEFLQIPTTYLDQVSAVAGNVSQFGYWCDTYFDYKVSMPLARYSVPSLQDPAYEHGEDVVLDRAGKQLS
ncbi:major capsid protein [Microvirus sp.]|nr:major capsid protein [Microvirus sp.]